MRFPEANLIVDHFDEPELDMVGEGANRNATVREFDLIVPLSKPKAEEAK